MKAKIYVDFTKINGMKVNKELLDENPELLNVTKTTLFKLCDTIKKYLMDYKIETEIIFFLEK